MSVCPRCGASFGCGMADASTSGEPCWCTQLPMLPREAYVVAVEGDPASSRCFCPDCLRALLVTGQSTNR